MGGQLRLQLQLQLHGVFIAFSQKFCVVYQFTCSCLATSLRRCRTHTHSFTKHRSIDRRKAEREREKRRKEKRRKEKAAPEGNNQGRKDILVFEGEGIEILG